jgi:type IV secretory pathway VirJ component
MKTPGRRRWTLALIGALGLRAAASATPGAEAASAIAQLPLIERPAERPTSDVFAIFLTGDGGWAALDRGITAELNARGVSVVGLNSRAYLSTRRTPDELARDLEAIVSHYERAWRKSDFILIGFSRGADLLPFGVSRFATGLRSRVRLVAMLGLGRIADFEFRLMDLIHFEPRDTSILVAPELEKLRGMNLLFVRGDEEEGAIGRELNPNLGRIVTLDGDHHLGRDYVLLGRLILGATQRQPQPPAAESTR